MTDPSQTRNSRFTWRAVALGTMLSLFMAIGAPYSRYVLGSSPMVFTSLSWGVVISWLLLLLVDMWVLRRIPGWKPLSAAEMVLIFIMASVGSSATTTEAAGTMVTMIGGIHYFGSPENRWHETFGHMLPLWQVPTDARSAVTWLFDGVPRGKPYPWGDWLVPLFWHGSFTAAFFLVQFAFVALLRKHWVEHERLTFPIMQVPLELISQPKPGEWTPPWARPRLFWIGFLIPFAFYVLQLLHWFWPVVPQIPTDLGQISFGPEFPALSMQLFWPVIGISFFANTEVIFSLFFFTVLGVLSMGWLQRLGIDVGLAQQPMQWLNTGALMAMVVWFLWQARGHLLSAARRALGKREGDDDSGELLSYRTAYLMAIGSFLYIVLWMIRSGMSVVIAVLLIVVTTILYLGIARLSFEAGVMHVNAPLRCADIIVDAVGSANLSPSTLVAVSQQYWRGVNIKSLFLVTFGHAGALTQRVGIPRRRTAIAAGIVTVVTTLVAIWYTMHLGFSIGGYNMPDGVYNSWPQDQPAALMRWLTDPKPADLRRISFFGIGVGLMGLFTWLRYMFPWWPLHPIGLAICFSYHISSSFLSFLIAWVTKSLTLRLGGITLYRRTVPLFTGIIVGAFAGTGLCFLADFIWFPLSGHAVEFK